MSIRKATRKDTNLIKESIIDYWNLLLDTYGEEGNGVNLRPLVEPTIMNVYPIFKSNVITDSDGYYIIEKDKKFAGFLAYSPEPGKPECYLYDIYVKPEFQGNGYGKELVYYAINLAKVDNKDSLVLWVDENNTKARQLYNSLGFVECHKERMPWIDQTGQTIVETESFKLKISIPQSS